MKKDLLFIFYAGSNNEKDHDLREMVVPERTSSFSAEDLRAFLPVIR